MIPLSQLKEGQRGVIARLNGRGMFRKRLQEMGFIKGVEVFVEKYAPLRDPMELVLKGYHVSLRGAEAAQVMIEKVEQELLSRRMVRKGENIIITAGFPLGVSGTTNMMQLVRVGEQRRP